MTSLIKFREIRIPDDVSDIGKFLDDSDRDRLQFLPQIIESGDGFAYVAESVEGIVGWVLVHSRYRSDIGWIPNSQESNYHNGENAYLENIKVIDKWQNKGLGERLLRMAESYAFKIGKLKMWLHVKNENEGAIRFYERERWTFQHKVYPEWYERKPMRVYCKELRSP